MTAERISKPTPKPVFWIGSSRRDLRSFPELARMTIGQALFAAQQGGKHPAAKPLKGFGGTGVLEIVETEESGAYRAVYTVKFARVVYALHVFQKKSKSGVKTPKADIELIKRRLKEAEKNYATWIENERREQEW